VHDLNLIQIILVTLVAFVAGMASVLDERQFHRPLVACTLTGIALGNPAVGIMVGGSLELLALGWMNVGAAMAPDSALASTISAVVVIQGHQDITTGIAIAVPLAAAGQVLTIFVRTITVFFQHQADNFAKKGKTPRATVRTITKPVENGQADPLFWVASNHQPLCRDCHSYKTRVIDQRGFGAKK